MTAERLWSRVAVGEPHECWPWTGGRTSDGHGALRWDGRSVKAHRVVWTLTNGPIPEGMLVRRICDDRLCCNPAHLTLRTVAEGPRSPLHRLRRMFAADPDTGCWNWTGATTRGYGVWSLNGVQLGAHRGVWLLLRGPIPDGLQLDHLCRNTRCVNPEHLEPVTPLENMRRGSRAQQTHCIHGHPFDEENTYVKPNGCRGCKTCRRENNRRWAERNGGRHR